MLPGRQHKRTAFCWDNRCATKKCALWTIIRTKPQIKWKLPFLTVFLFFTCNFLPFPLLSFPTPHPPLPRTLRSSIPSRISIWNPSSESTLETRLKNFAAGQQQVDAHTQHKILYSCTHTYLRRTTSRQQKCGKQQEELVVEVPSVVDRRPHNRASFFGRLTPGQEDFRAITAPSRPEPQES